MDVERTEKCYPIVTLIEDIEKIILMKTALVAITDEYERSLIAAQNRLKAGKKQIEVCTHESNSLQMKINNVQAKISETFLKNHDSEADALNTVQENRTLKRKIIVLKHDMEQQEKLLKRAGDTLNVMKKKKALKLTAVVT